jgi:hypothetical protein
VYNACHKSLLTLLILFAGHFSFWIVAYDHLLFAALEGPTGTYIAIVIMNTYYTCSDHLTMCASSRSLRESIACHWRVDTSRYESLVRAHGVRSGTSELAGIMSFFTQVLAESFEVDGVSRIASRGSIAILLSSTGAASTAVGGTATAGVGPPFSEQLS